jgi:hypothetical protein
MQPEIITQQRTPSAWERAARWAARWPAALLYFTLLSILMTWPLIRVMGTHLVGSVGDNIYFVWMIGWIQKALFQLGANPFDVWFLNYPEGWNMAYTEITPAQLALALPFSLLGGSTFGYNAAMLLTFILSGLTMFLWVRRLTGSGLAGLVSGTIFAFLPYRFAHYLIGHLNLSGTQWFPLYFWGLFDLLGARRFSWKPALLAGLGLGLIALTSQYYVYMALLVSVPVALVWLLLDRGQLRSRVFWRGVGAALLAGLPLVAVAVGPYVFLAGQGGLPDRGLGVVRPYSASPTDFLLPSTDHFLWGQWVGSHFNREMWVEGTLTIGFMALILAGVALWKRRESGSSRLLWAMLAGTVTAVILAMGTDLHWNGAPVEIATPAFLSRWVERPTLPLPLPGYALFEYFPFFAKLRAFMRFGVFALVFCSAAAGLGAAWLLQHAGRRRVALAGLLLALVLVEFYPGPFPQFFRVESRPVDAWLARQPGQGAVAQFPFVEAEDQEQTYYTLAHGKPFIGGFFNAFPPAQYARIAPVLNHFPDADSVALLRELGVEWVLVHSARYPDMPALRATCEQLGLRFVTETGGQAVFTLPR